MDELKLYKRMYAAVIGEVDLTIQIIERALMENNGSREILAGVAEQLKKTLLDAEEMYLGADEE